MHVCVVCWGGCDDFASSRLRPSFDLIIRLFQPNPPVLIPHTSVLTLPAQLHSTAAYYPEAPTAEEQGLARALIQSVAAFYPCGYCRKDFQKSVKADPPMYVT